MKLAQPPASDLEELDLGAATGSGGYPRAAEGGASSEIREAPDGDGGDGVRGGGGDSDCDISKRGEGSNMGPRQSSSSGCWCFHRGDHRWR